MSEELVGQALDDRSEQEGGEERERADEHDDADQQHDERRRCRCASCRGRRARSACPPASRRPRARSGSARSAPNIIVRPPSRSANVMPWAPTLPAFRLDRSRCSRRTPSRCCSPATCRRRASRRSPAGRRRRSTARRTSCRARARLPISTASGVNRTPIVGELDLARLDLLAQELRRAPDHQPADEHGEEHEQQHRVEAGADAAEDRLARGQVRERDSPPMPVSDSIAALTAPHEVTVVTAVQQRRARDPEALLLALHVAARRAGEVVRVDAGDVLRGRAVLLGEVDDDHAGDEQRPPSRRRSPSPAGGCRPCARTCT